MQHSIVEVSAQLFYVYLFASIDFEERTKPAISENERINRRLCVAVYFQYSLRLKCANDDFLGNWQQPRQEQQQKQRKEPIGIYSQRL